MGEMLLKRLIEEALEWTNLKRSLIFLG